MEQISLILSSHNNYFDITAKQKKQKKERQWKLTATLCLGTYVGIVTPSTQPTEMARTRINQLKGQNRITS